MCLVHGMAGKTLGLEPEQPGLAVRTWACYVPSLSFYLLICQKRSAVGCSANETSIVIQSRVGTQYTSVLSPFLVGSRTRRAETQP